MQEGIQQGMQQGREEKRKIIFNRLVEQGLLSKEEAEKQLENVLILLEFLEKKS